MRILATGDWHCGHVVGLTPPAWQFQPTGEKYHDKHAKIQNMMWEWWVENINRYKPFDRMIINGDAIDGKGFRSGGTELITSDRLAQAQMALAVAETVDPTEIAMTFGTAYHTGTDEDMETVVADKLGASIEGHLEREVEGVRIDARHFVGGSSIPHGRFNALAREDMWRLIWADRSQKFAPHLVLRSHVHYYGFCGNEFATMMTLPCMQGLGSKYGSRMCSGTVSLGFVVIDCNDGQYSWEVVTIPLAEQVSEWKPW